MKRLSVLLTLGLVAAACGDGSGLQDKDNTSACDGLFDGDVCDLGDGLCIGIERNSGPECEEDPGICVDGVCVPADEVPDPDPEDPVDPDDPDDPDDPEDPIDPDDPEDPEDPEDPVDPDDPPLCEPEACESDNECTFGTCEDDECVFLPVDDGQACGDRGVCMYGECTPIEPPDPITIEQDLYCKYGFLPFKIPTTLTVAPEAPFVAGEPTPVTTSVTATLSKWVAKLAMKSHHNAKATLKDASAEIRASGCGEPALHQAFEGLPNKIEFTDHHGRPQENTIDSGAFTQPVTPSDSATEISFKLRDLNAKVIGVPSIGKIELPGDVRCHFGHGASAKFDVEAP